MVSWGKAGAIINSIRDQSGAQIDAQDGAFGTAAKLSERKSTYRESTN